MSLATQCPHCHTTFKVGDAQLKLQAGLVRCGVCQQVFNGIEQLLETNASASAEVKEEDRLAEPVAPPSPVVARPAAIPIADIRKTPESDIGQFSFLKKTNTQKRLNWVWAVPGFLLFLLFIGQLIFQFRDVIAATYPASKPTLANLCQYAHCQIQLPAQIDALSVESEALHTLPRANTFELNVLLRNRSALTQAWPHIELTLKNAQRQIVAKQAFSPPEYLTSEAIATGFPTHQEQEVNLFFELDRMTASDFSVAIYYPAS